MTTNETRDVVGRATVLNAQGKHREAIELIEQNIQQFDPDLRFNGLKEVFQAAKSSGNKVLATTVAREIAKEFPDLPSIQEYL